MARDRVRSVGGRPEVYGDGALKGDVPEGWDLECRSVGEERAKKKGKKVSIEKCTRRRGEGGRSKRTPSIGTLKLQSPVPVALP
jgi:hypothetical protein